MNCKPNLAIGQRWLFSLDPYQWSIVETLSFTNNSSVKIKVVSVGPDCKWTQVGDIFDHENLGSDLYTYLDGQDKPISEISS